MELEAENAAPNRTWTPVVPVPSETVAVAMFQWKRLPISRGIIVRYVAYALLIVVACAAVGYAVAAAGTKEYGARTEIYYPLNEQLASGSFLREDRNLSSQLVEMTSHEVLDPVSAQYHISYNTLESKELVSVLQASEVIRIEVDDPSPSRALALDAAIGAGYMKTQADEDLVTESYLNGRINSVNQQLATLTSEFNADEARRQNSATVADPNPAESPAELNIQSQISSDTNEIQTLHGQLDTVTIDELNQPHVTQITKPYLLTSPVAPKPLRVALAGALAGIMLAAIAVGFLLRRLLKRRPLDQLD
ncbi:MAG: hypothetical protein ACLPVY_09360 [Acidimicrobiia bacterium]